MEPLAQVSGLGLGRARRRGRSAIHRSLTSNANCGKPGFAREAGVLGPSGRTIVELLVDGELGVMQPLLGADAILPQQWRPACRRARQELERRRESYALA